MESEWMELRAVQLRRGHSCLNDTLREAVREFIDNDRSSERRSAA